MKSSCIPHVPNDPFIYLRKWAVDACDNNRCAAVLLALFEHHYNGIRNNNELFGSRDFAYPRSLDEWRKDTFGLFSTRDITRALECLEAKGFIEISDHPDPAMRHQRKKWYRFHPERVIEWILASGKMAEKPEERSAHNQILKNDDLITLTGVEHEDFQENPENSHFQSFKNEETCGFQDEEPVEHREIPHFQNLENQEIPHFLKSQNVYKVLTNLRKQKEEREEERESLIPNAVPESSPAQNDSPSFGFDDEEWPDFEPAIAFDFVPSSSQAEPDDEWSDFEPNSAQASSPVDECPQNDLTHSDDTATPFFHAAPDNPDPWDDPQPEPFEPESDWVEPGRANPKPTAPPFDPMNRVFACPDQKDLAKRFYARVANLRESLFGVRGNYDKCLYIDAEFYAALEIVDIDTLIAICDCLEDINKETALRANEREIRYLKEVMTPKSICKCVAKHHNTLVEWRSARNGRKRLRTRVVM